MRVTKRLAIADLAALVCDACRARAIDVVLSGGACVSIFAGNRYRSFDLDFVLTSAVPRRKLRLVMETLGFREDGRHFRHPESAYIVEFLQPPLSVGSEPVREIREIRRGSRTLRLLSPTDCVKDRLAAFYHWNDQPSLEQAVLVCAANDVDLGEVRRWSRQEGMSEKHGLFRRALTRSTAPAPSKRTPV